MIGAPIKVIISTPTGGFRFRFDALAKSNRLNRQNKPEKPAKDFPLFPHQNGQWAKKIRRRIYYFGTWDDPESARAEWEFHEDAIRSTGEKLPDNGSPHGASGTLEDVRDSFLNDKRDLVDADELSPRTFKD